MAVADGRIVLGGSFSAFNGILRSRLVRLHGGEGLEVLSPLKPVLPALKLARSGGELVLTWPAAGTANPMLEFSNSRFTT
jgi:hypothetical protein